MPRKAATGRIIPYRTVKKYKLKDGSEKSKTVYQARVVIGITPMGKPKRKTVEADTKIQCTQKLNALLKEIRENGVPLDHTQKFGPYARQWFETKEAHIDSGTQRQYRAVIENHLAPLHNIPLVSLTGQSFQRVLNNARAKGLSESTRNRIRQVAKQIMKQAMLDRLISYNPVDATAPQVSKDAAIRNRSRSAFSVPEVKEMLRVASTKPVEDGAIYWWRLLTGMRQGEILGAQREYLHLDVEHPYYEVLWQLQDVNSKHGCGKQLSSGAWPCGKQKAGCCPQREWRIPDGFEMTHVYGQWCLVRPKTSTRHVVPMLPELQEVMRRYFIVTEDWPNPHNLIFRHRDGKPYVGEEERGMFSQLMRDSGLDTKKHTGHETRYAMVTILRNSGVDPAVVQSIVGHSSIEVDDIYYTLDNKVRADAMSNVDRSLDLRSIGWGN